MCHGQGKLKPAPANHASYTAEMCTTCHKQPAASGSGSAGTPGADATPQASAKPINHSIASDMFKDCVACHGEGKMKPFPANHVSFAADSCTTCHKPQVQ